jgi:hypothetical protein
MRLWAGRSCTASGIHPLPCEDREEKGTVAPLWLWTATPYGTFTNGRAGALSSPCDGKLTRRSGPPQRWQVLSRMEESRTRQLHIPTAEFIEDIRRGMSDQGLMDKYGIARHKTLTLAFDRLVDSGRLSREELSDRGSFISTQVIADLLGDGDSPDDSD